jgi:hypothetical protein
MLLRASCPNKKEIGSDLRDLRDFRFNEMQSRQSHLAQYKPKPKPN